MQGFPTDRRWLSAYLAAANVAARQVVLDRRRPRISAPVLDPAQRAIKVYAVLVECGATN